MSDRPSGAAPARLVAVLGPTNTGKTHLAVERMLGHASGMIGLPLRLLAREIYERIVKARGARCVALITGEEKIIPPRPSYYVCTVEAMPLNREVEFLAVDEIQLCADPARGHVFTQRLLHARGSCETMFLGAGTLAPLIRRLLPDAEFVTRERFSKLTYDGPKKLSRLPRRSAVVAFSTDAVYAIAELIRRQRGGAAVVMGSLSPRTRNAQVALYQSGEVDFLVATDAIGMGLNMDVDHVAFAGLRKFDGKRTRWLYPQEIGQIAGRAGRFRSDGTFGVTGECPEMDEDQVSAVENHAFESITGAEWRNSRLEFQSLPTLIRSLAEPPSRDGLNLAEESLDETALRRMALDEDVARRCRDKSNLMRLWDVCQTPDFRKTTLDDHLRMVRDLFMPLTQGSRRAPTDWIAEQFRALDRLDGDIDALSGRLSSVRTLAYIANRPDWLADPAHWQGQTKTLEERLSDTLHERLMQRFIDRRTSALMHGLRQREDLLAGLGTDGTVTVEGHFVGQLSGLQFVPAQGESELEDKALRAAAQRAVGPEIARRLGTIAAEPDEAFALMPDGAVLWNGEAAGRLEVSRLFAPRVRLFGELGPAPARERATRRLEAFLAAEAGRRLGPLRDLESAIQSGKIKGLARGIAYQLAETGGILDRSLVETEVRALSPVERRHLRAIGVRFGAFSLFLPALLTPEALGFTRAFASVEHPDWPAAFQSIGPLPSAVPSARTLAAYGLRAVGAFTVPVLMLEQLDSHLRTLPAVNGAMPLTSEAIEALGWTPSQAEWVLRGLNFAPVGKPVPGEPRLWRRRRADRAERAKAPELTAKAQAAMDRAVASSPFAALAALKTPPSPPQMTKPARRRRRPVRKIAIGQKGQAE